MHEIKYLPSFQQDLDAIVDYISLTLEAPRAALNLLDELDISINKLKEFPNVIADGILGFEKLNTALKSVQKSQRIK